MSFDVAKQPKENIDYKEKENEHNYKNTFDKDIAPAYLNFRGNIEDQKNLKLNQCESSNIDCKNIEQGISDNYMREKKIDDFYAKLRNQPLLDNSNCKIIAKNNINNNGKNNFEGPKNNENNVHLNKKENNKNKIVNTSTKKVYNVIKFDNYETPKSKNEICSKLDKHKSKLNNQCHSISNLNKNINKDSKEILQNKFVKLTNDNFNHKKDENTKIFNTSKSSFIKKQSSQKNLTKSISIINDKNSDQNNISKLKHQRFNSQTAVKINDLKNNKLLNGKGVDIKNKNNLCENYFINDSNINRNKNQNMNDVKRMVDKNQIQEINDFKKEQIIESRKFLNEFLNKRIKDSNKDNNGSGEKCNNINNSWKKNIKINMSDT